MLHTKFQASRPKVSEEEFVLIFLYVFLRSEPKTPLPGAILGPGIFIRKQTWLRTTKQCYIPKFKHLSQEVLMKKTFKYFSMYFYGLNLGPPVADPSWTLGPSFE